MVTQGHIQENGNFNVMIQYATRHTGVLCDHLANIYVQHNATYMSPTIQHELLDLTGNQIWKSIVSIQIATMRIALPSSQMSQLRNILQYVSDLFRRNQTMTIEWSTQFVDNSCLLFMRTLGLKVMTWQLNTLNQLIYRT